MVDGADKQPGGAWSFGAGGRSVARVGFGAMQLSGPGGRPAPPQETAITVLRRAVELGVNHIDTAQFYGVGRANELIRLALHPYPEELVIVSKVGTRREGEQLRPAQRPEELREQVEANLGTLGVERLDVVNMRRMDEGSRVRAEGDQLVDLDSQLAELVALREEGKLGGIGLSTVTADQVRQGLPVGLACVQNAYSLLDRTDEPLLDLCREHDVAWVPYFPLGSAFPMFDKVTDVPEVIQIAAELGATPAQVGLAWLLAHGPHVLLIPGTTSVEHLEQNLGTAAVHLDDEMMATLEQVAPASQ